MMWFGTLKEENTVLLYTVRRLLCAYEKYTMIFQIKD